MMYSHHGFECLLQPEGEDDLKKMQLMELAIINGTYRDTKQALAAAAAAAAAARKCPTLYYIHRQC